MGELGDGGGLARAIDADHQDHLRAREGGDFEWLGYGAQDLGDLFRHRFLQLALGNAEAEALFFQLFADPACSARAEVGYDQGVLDIVECGIVELGRADNAGEVVRQPFRRLAEAAEQPFAPAFLTHASRPSRNLVGVTSTIVPGAVLSGTRTRAKFCE